MKTLEELDACYRAMPPVAAMGIQSAVYAGLVGNALAMLFLILRLRHKNHVMAPDRELLAALRLDRVILGKVLRIGLPTGLQMVVLSNVALGVAALPKLAPAGAAATFWSRAFLRMSARVGRVSVVGARSEESMIFGSGLAGNPKSSCTGVSRGIASAAAVLAFRPARVDFGDPAASVIPNRAATSEPGMINSSSMS